MFSFDCLVRLFPFAAKNGQPAQGQEGEGGGFGARDLPGERATVVSAVGDPTPLEGVDAIGGGGEEVRQRAAEIDRLAVGINGDRAAAIEDSGRIVAGVVGGELECATAKSDAATVGERRRVRQAEHAAVHRRRAGEAV